jgi:hypothetical protein
MKSLTVLLASLLMLGEVTVALAETVMVIPTDNGSTNVQVSIDKGSVKDGQFAIDQPHAVTFNLKFLDPVTNEPVHHLNYDVVVSDQDGNMAYKVHEGHAHDGTNAYTVLLPDTGSFTLTIGIEGVGAMKPYDSTYNGTASSVIAVTPEFPVSIMAVMAMVAGVGIAVSRLKLN